MAKLDPNEGRESVPPSKQAPTGKSQHRAYERRPLETPSNFRRLGCSVTRSYGAIEINFSTEGEFDVGSNDEQKRVLGMLYKQINSMHDEWALNELPHIPNLERRKESDGAGEYEADYIYWNTEREPHRLMLVTTSGKYSKYGARIGSALYSSFFNLIPNDIAHGQRHFIKGVIARVDETGSVVDLK